MAGLTLLELDGKWIDLNSIQAVVDDGAGDSVVLLSGGHKVGLNLSVREVMDALAVHKSMLQQRTFRAP